MKQLVGEINYIKDWQRRINTTSGTKSGGLKAKLRNLEKDPDFYRNIGRKGGQNGHTGGFASMSVGKDGLTGSERARLVGQRGGRISKRGKAIKK